MKQGYQLLKIINSESNVSSEILPQSYVDFANKFILGEGSFANEKLRREGIDFDIPLTNTVLELEGGDIELEYLYSVEQIHSMLGAGEDQGSFYVDDGMVRIAHLTSHPGSSLFMSVDMGRIFIGRYILDSSEKYRPIAEDVFKMVLLLKSKSNRHQLNDETKPLLFKNWGEDFWRVREKESV